MRYSKKSNSLISEDINLSGIDWENDCVQNNQEYLIQFVNTIHDCFLSSMSRSQQRRRNTEHTWSGAPTRDYFKGDYEKIANILDDNDWPTILQGEISVSYDNLCSVLEQTVTDHIPLKFRRNKKKNLYMNRNAIKMKDRKNQLWKTYCKAKSHQCSQKFKRCRDELRCLTRQLRITFENKLMKTLRKTQIILEVCKFEIKNAYPDPHTN